MVQITLICIVSIAMSVSVSSVFFIALTSSKPSKPTLLEGSCGLLLIQKHSYLLSRRSYPVVQEHHLQYTCQPCWIFFCTFALLHFCALTRSNWCCRIYHVLSNFLGMLRNIFIVLCSSYTHWIFWRRTYANAVYRQLYPGKGYVELLLPWSWSFEWLAAWTNDLVICCKAETSLSWLEF